MKTKANKLVCSRSQEEERVININMSTAPELQNKIRPRDRATWNSLVTVVRTKEVEMVQASVLKEFCCEKAEKCSNNWHGWRAQKGLF